MPIRLQRITTTSRWIPEIDGLRFVAIASVLLVHVFDQMVTRGGYYEPFSNQHPVLLRQMNLLGRGVEVFFVISGFILAQPFLRQFQDGGKRVDLGGFYLRRLTRLEPPYILALLLYASAMVLFRHGSAHVVGLSLLTSVLYVHNFFRSLPPVNFVTWSLEVEVVFYLLSPLLAYVFAIRSRKVRTTVLLAAIAVDAFIPWTGPTRVGFFFPAEMCYFLVGYLLADLRIHQREAWKHPLWDVASFTLWPVLFLFPQFRWSSPVLCVLLMVCFCASFLGPATRHLLGVQWVALFGGMCYSTYLLHALIISTLFPLTRRFISGDHIYASYVGQAVLLLTAIVAASLLYFVAIERPCMDPRWPQKLAHTLLRRKMPSTPVA